MHIISTNNTLMKKRSKLDDLVSRLNHGESMIKQLQSEHKPIGELEQHWLNLLHEYEVEFRTLQQAA